jgi:hypothetical protein
VQQESGHNFPDTVVSSEAGKDSFSSALGVLGESFPYGYVTEAPFLVSQRLISDTKGYRDG